MATVCSRRLFSAASQRRCSGQVTHFEDHGLVYHNGTGAAMAAGGFESRFHMAVGESEASLLGVVYTEEGVMTAAPYKVVEPEHCKLQDALRAGCAVSSCSAATVWAGVFEGTGLRADDVFGAASFNERIPGGASGHETDKRSPSSPPGTKLLAKGMNPLAKWTPLENDAPVSGQNAGYGHGGGGEMIYYDTDSGGACFSAGSITWPTALLCEPSVSAITKNVLNKFSQ